MSTALLELDLLRPSAPPPLCPSLVTRLRAHGVTAPIETHANRRVLVSLGSRGALRVHQGYASAPDPVLRAIAQWARPRLRLAERRAAQRVLTAFPVHEHAPPTRAPRRVVAAPRPGDERILTRLSVLHSELNQRHFAGALGAVRLVLSAKMRRRLGEFRPPDAPGEPAVISISRRHLRRDGWRSVQETLAHELVHQWQFEAGHRLGHDSEFRRRCRAMGIDPHATRRLDNDLPRRA